jgi:hypothetical protein
VSLAAASKRPVPVPHELVEETRELLIRVAAADSEQSSRLLRRS